MEFISNLTVTTLFPAILLLLTTEIILASYKATSPKWTSGLAYSNLIINVAWTILIIVLLLNPSLISPYLADVIADVFQRSPEDISTQVHLIIMGVGLASIATTIIDSFAGFKNLKCEKSEVNEASHE